MPSIRCCACANGLVDQYLPPGPHCPDAILPGETVSGFGFIASVYDPNPKLYIYELEGNCAPVSGKVSAAGYTVVPEPAGLASLGFLLAGGLGVRMARRRRRR